MANRAETTTELLLAALSNTTTCTQCAALLATVDEPVFVLTAEGRIAAASPALATRRTETADSLRGASLSTLLADVDAARVQTLCRALDRTATAETDDERTAQLDVRAYQEFDETVSCQLYVRQCLFADNCGFVCTLTPHDECSPDNESAPRDSANKPAENETGSPSGSVAPTPVDGAVLNRICDPIYAIDTQWKITYVNPQAAAHFERQKADLLGVELSSLVAPSEQLTLQQECEHALESQSATRFEQFHAATASWLEYRLFPSADGLTISLTDVTDRRNQAAIRLQQTHKQGTVGTLGQLALKAEDLDDFLRVTTQLVAEALDIPHCGIYRVNDDKATLELTHGVGFRDEELGVETVSTTEESLVGAGLESTAPVLVADLESDDRIELTSVEASHQIHSGLAVRLGPADSPWGVMVVYETTPERFTGDDATFVHSVANILAATIDRRHRRTELERYKTIIESINDGVYVVDDAGTFTLVNNAFVELTGYSRGDLLGSPRSQLISTEPTDPAMSATERSSGGKPGRGTAETTIETAAGDTIIVETTDARLETHDGAEQIAVVRDITERKAAEYRLTAQQAQLAALNEVNQVVNRVSDAVIEQSTREEIEQTVCEALVDSSSYLFAWIAEIDPRTKRIIPRVEAGVTDYVESIPLSIDGTVPYGKGPLSQAVHTQRMQVSTDVLTDPSFEPWRADAVDRGYRSAAAIPLQYNGTQYGVLCIAGVDTDSFCKKKQAILRQLGETIGHAIAALDRRRALLSDEADLVELRIRDFFPTVCPALCSTEPITFTRALPVDSGAFLVFGQTSTAGFDVVKTAVTQLTHWSGLRPIDTESKDGHRRFQLRVTEPSVLATVSSLGGRLVTGRIEAGEYYLAVQLPHGIEARQLVEAIRATHGSVDLLSRRQTVPVEESVQQPRYAVGDLCTERQQTVLEAAYFAGFFEWPRDQSGTEIADTLDIAPATFHQHLRIAERKLIGRLLEPPTENRLQPASSDE